jgi:redox-sensitive bicupin YhaK (pirin superfamily)
LLDEIHSANPSEYERGFPSHPHRGFETVSFMLEGRFRHRDSRGGGGVVVPGGAQWMTAGSGIVHSEMPETDAASTELWGFQLWVNLPRAEKWRAPGYEEIAPGRVAEVPLDRGGVLRVTAGELLGARGPVAPRTTQPILATLRMAAGDDVELRIPRDHSAFVLAAEGSPTIGPRGEAIPESALAQLTERGELVRIRSDHPAQLLVLAGAPIREPIAHGGPFVMNTQEEIEQAFADYRAGRLG